MFCKTILFIALFSVGPAYAYGPAWKWKMRPATCEYLLNIREGKGVFETWGEWRYNLKTREVFYAGTLIRFKPHYTPGDVFMQLLEARGAVVPEAVLWSKGRTSHLSSLRRLIALFRQINPASTRYGSNRGRVISCRKLLRIPLRFMGHFNMATWF